MRIRTTAAASILAILATVGGSTWTAPAEAAAFGVRASAKVTGARMVPVTGSGYLSPVMSARGPVEGPQHVTVTAHLRTGWVVLAEGETVRDRFVTTFKVDSWAARLPRDRAATLWLYVSTDDSDRLVKVTVKRPGC